jgi:tetratricopeptide (TPR) repeat protein
MSRATAYLENATRSRGPITDVRRLARLRADEADQYDRLGDATESEARYEAAFLLYESAPDPGAEASARVNLAALLLRLNRVDEAQQELRRAREILRVNTNVRGSALGAVHNNLGIAFQQLGDLEAARAEYVRANALLADARNRLAVAETLENIAIVDLMMSGTDSVAERIERALSVYDSLGNFDRQLKSQYNLLVVYESVGDARGKLMIPRMFRILREHEVDHATEANILFGLLPQLVRRSDLIPFRERVLHLYARYTKSGEAYGLGRSALQLARIEQALGNHDRAREYAEQAEPHAAAIPALPRIQFHADLGFFLVATDRRRGLDHFWRAFDLVEESDTNMRLLLLGAISPQLPSLSGDLRAAQRAKLQVVATLPDSAVAGTAKRLLDRMP